MDVAVEGCKKEGAVRPARPSTIGFMSVVGLYYNWLGYKAEISPSVILCLHFRQRQHITPQMSHCPTRSSSLSPLEGSSAARLAIRCSPGLQLLLPLRLASQRKERY